MEARMLRLWLKFMLFFPPHSRFQGNLDQGGPKPCRAAIDSESLFLFLIIMMIVITHFYMSQLLPILISTNNRSYFYRSWGWVFLGAPVVKLLNWWKRALRRSLPGVSQCERGAVFSGSETGTGEPSERWSQRDARNNSLGKETVSFGARQPNSDTRPFQCSIKNPYTKSITQGVRTPEFPF